MAAAFTLRISGRVSEQEDGRASLEQENTHVLLEDSQGSQYALTVTKTQPKVKGVVVVSRYGRGPPRCRKNS